MYKSPINIIIDEMHIKFAESIEQKIFQAIQDIEIHIDKDGLIKALKYDRDQYEKGYADAKAETHWIPCSERLPEVGQSVLLSIGGMYAAEGCLREDGDWTQFRWSAIQRKDMVGEWMPLPKPYEGESDEIL